MLAGLIGADDLNYLGAFNVPTGDIGDSTFEYGGTAITYNPNNNSLFMVGHDWQQAIAEVSIPIPTTGTLETLANATMLQPFSPVLNRLPNNTLQAEEMVKVGGLLVHGNELVGTAYEYYDGNGDAVDSHFKTSSLNLGSSAVSGLFQVGELGGGFVGGYMAEVPPEWQDAFGASHVTGQAAIPIISRTSAGPSLFGFNPAQLGVGVSTATPLVYYPLDNPLAPVHAQNPLFNTTTGITGVVFPEGTDSVLFFGSHGVGPWWYGEADEGGIDPYRSDKGPHAPEYVYQVWAYDAKDLAAVKNGQMQPWEIQPYDVWDFDLPYPEGSKHIGGVAFDSATGTIYVSQQYGNEAYPVVHAFQVGTPAPIVNESPTGVTLANLVHSLPEMTPVTGDVKLADIIVADDGLGTNALSLTGVDQSYFSIVGTSLFLNGGVQLDYETKAAFNVTVLASDLSLGGEVSVVYTLNVTDINDAPVLDHTLSPTLPLIQEDTSFPAGATVLSLIHGAVSDVDVAPLRGIAVTGASGIHGDWQSSLDGGTTWQAMGSVSESAARLLPDWSQLRFLPNADFNGTVELDYRAWDQTQGSVGGTFNLSGNTGGSTGFSTERGIASLTVTPVNDAPVLDNTLSPTLPSIQEDTSFSAGATVLSLIHGAVSDVDVAPLPGVAVTGASGYHGAWETSLDGGTTWQAMGSVSESAARLLPDWSQVRFLPKADFNGTVKLYYHAWDQTQGSVYGTFNLSGNTSGSTAFSTARGSASLTVTPVNDPPRLSLSGSMGYRRDAAAITLAPNASVSDIDSANLANGRLRVRITDGASSSNRLLIGSGFSVDANNNVLQGSTIIGKRASNGFGTKELIVTFNSRATPAIAQQLVRAITFKTRDGAAGQRTVLFTVSDGKGGLSDEVIKQVNVT